MGGRHHLHRHRRGLALLGRGDRPVQPSGLFSRQVIGWSLCQDMTRDIVVDALRMAWFKRHPNKDARLIFHSDRAASTPAKTSVTR
jgi:hypothetical protein